MYVSAGLQLNEGSRLQLKFELPVAGDFLSRNTKIGESHKP